MHVNANQNTSSLILILPKFNIATDHWCLEDDLLPFGVRSFFSWWSLKLQESTLPPIIMEVGKWVPPIWVSFHLGWFSTSMKMGERLYLFLWNPTASPTFRWASGHDLHLWLASALSLFGCKWGMGLLMEKNPAPVGMVRSISHYLQGFIHVRWCRISSINRILALDRRVGHGNMCPPSQVGPPRSLGAMGTPITQLFSPMGLACLEVLKSFPWFDLAPNYVTGFQKYCSQNLSDNAFTCATLILLILKNTLADNHITADNPS